MTNLIIESAPSVRSKPDGVAKIKDCGVIRLLGNGLNFQVYEDENHNAYVQAHLIDIPPAPSQSFRELEIDQILINPEGVKITGKAIPRSQLRIVRDGQLIRDIIADNEGNYEIAGLRRGSYKIEGIRGLAALVMASDDGT